MKIPFVDIHTHRVNNIDNENFLAIRSVDVDSIVNVDASSFYSVGVHPWELGQQSLSHLGDSVTQRLGDSHFLAIGECGLDRACRHDFELQKETFMRQIEISEQYQKPLIIHCVRAYPDIISIRKTTRAAMPWIIHGFQGNEQSATQLLRHDIYFSLGEMLFRDDDKAVSLLDTIPKERLFLETDDSGRDIAEVYDKICRLISVDIEDLKTVIFNNFIKVFGDIWNGIQGHNC